MISFDDIAYTAGIIDGEGYIGIVKTHRKSKITRYELRVAVTMCNSLIPAWLHANFGGSYYIFQPPSLKHKRLYAWRLATFDAGEFLKVVLPYLKMKQEAARIGIEFQSYREKNYCRRKPKPDVVYQAEAILHKRLTELHERQYQEGVSLSCYQELKNKNLYGGKKWVII